MLTHMVDIPLFTAYGLVIVGGALPHILARKVWVRPLCVGLILLATSFGLARFYLAPRMAMSRLDFERREIASFRDGCFYTWYAASTALPIFVLAIGSLAVLALVPPRRTR